MHRHVAIAVLAALAGCSAPMMEPEGITFTRPSGGGPGVLFINCNMTETAFPADEAENPSALADRTFQGSCTPTDLMVSGKTTIARAQDTLTVTEDHSIQGTSRAGMSAPTASVRTTLPVEVCGSPAAGKRLKVDITLDGPLTNVDGSNTQRIELITPAIERKTAAGMTMAGAAVQQTYESAEGPGRQCISFRVWGHTIMTTPIVITGQPPETRSATSKGTFVMRATVE